MQDYLWIIILQASYHSSSIKNNARFAAHMHDYKQNPAWSHASIAYDAVQRRYGILGSLGADGAGDHAFREYRGASQDHQALHDLANVLDMRAVEIALESLTRIEREVVSLTYGLDCTPAMDSKEISLRLGICRAWVYKLDQNARRKLHQWFLRHEYGKESTLRRQEQLTTAMLGGNGGR